MASTLKRQASTSSLKQDNNTVSDKQEVAADAKAEKTRKKVDGRKKDASKAVKKEKEEEREVKVKEEADEEALPPVRKSIRTGENRKKNMNDLYRLTFSLHADRLSQLGNVRNERKFHCGFFSLSLDHYELHISITSSLDVGR